MYKKTSGSIVVFLILYVNDILLIENDIPKLLNVKQWLGKCFSMEDLGDAETIQGIRIYRDRSEWLLGLSQKKYIDKVLKRFSMVDSKKYFIPLQQGVVLSKKDSPSTREQREYMSKIPYVSTIGFIIYAMLCTNLDIAHALSMTNKFQQDPVKNTGPLSRGFLSTYKGLKDSF